MTEVSRSPAWSRRLTRWVATAAIAAFALSACDDRPKTRRRSAREQQPTRPAKRAKRRKPAPKPASRKPAKRPPPRRTVTSGRATKPARQDHRAVIRQHSQPGLVRRIEEATVMVLASRGGSGSLGTGFFVTRRLIVTNRHVVDGARPGSIRVVNRKLGRLRSVELVSKTTGSVAMRDGDYAILRLPRPVKVQPFALTDSLAKLDRVVAAGFPSLVVETDIQFERLLSGRMKAMPDLAMTSGEVSAIQNRDVGRVPLIVHTAPISPGNSGGPLVDSCGRVVGVNTFIRARDGVSTNYTLASTHLSGFLRSIRGAKVERSRARCKVVR